MRATASSMMPGDVTQNPRGSFVLSTFSPPSNFYLSELSGVFSFPVPIFATNSRVLLSTTKSMAFRTLSAKAATALDQELMSTGAFSIDQLMELAGLAVSQVVHHVHPPSRGNRILVACGPGNNGGDGLVAARHLRHFGYQPSVYYPKRSKNDLYQRLYRQLEDLDVAFVDDFVSALKSSDHVVDAIFGFSFSGEVREPFPAVIKALEETKLPVTSVDAPSSWDIEGGPPQSGLGSKFHPDYLISLTAPKPLSQHFQGRHFVGGRFVSPGIARKYGLEIPEYQGVDQFVEVGAADARKL